jgi:hypothetical protein
MTMRLDARLGIEASTCIAMVLAEDVAPRISLSAVFCRVSNEVR